MENLSVRVGSLGCLAGLFSGSMEGFGVFAGAWSLAAESSSRDMPSFSSSAVTRRIIVTSLYALAQAKRMKGCS